MNIKQYSLFQYIIKYLYIYNAEGLIIFRHNWLFFLIDLYYVWRNIFCEKNDEGPIFIKNIWDYAWLLVL